MSSFQANIITKNPATPTGPAQNGSAPGMWRMDEAAYWKKQGLWPTAGVLPSDAYFPYVTMLLSTTSLGNANNNLFVDSSGAFNPISRNGNTTQGSVTPYGANWSNYFDGTGDEVLAPNAPANFGSNNFTAECWVYFTTNSVGYQPIMGNNGSSDAQGWIISTETNNRLYFYYSVNGSSWAGSIDTGITPTVNVWTHIAIVRNGSAITFYVNGVASGTPISTSSSLNSPSGNFRVGRYPYYPGGARTLTGYISNVRLVNGTAVYTSNFTPSTTPLTAVSGTTLLTCQSNRFFDASSNNYAITIGGNPSVTDFSPFSPGSPGISYNQSDIQYWSGYFDGSGDYLSAANNAAFQFGTGDFTVECWINKPAAANGSVVDVRSGGTGAVPWAFYVDASNFPYFYDGTTYTSSVAITTNAWNHIAVVRTSGTLKIFVNGVQGYSQAHSVSLNATGSLLIGGTAAYTTGYISNLRIVKGTAVYTSAFTPPTTPLTAISGTSLLTCQSAAFTDNSTNNFAITINGNTTVTGNNPFQAGYYSNYFDGSGDYLGVAASSALNQSGDFTVEGWVHLTASPSNTTPIYAFEVTNFMKFAITSSRNLSVDQANVGVRFTGSTVLALNTWYHVAFVRSGSASNNCKVYLNGVQEGQFSDTSTATASGTGRIFSRPDATSGFIPGYLSNLRVTNTAVYTAAFTPSTTPLTAITGTQLLTCQSGRFIDASANAIALTRNGDVSVQSFDPFYTSTIASNGGSMYFDGSGDYLLVPDSPQWVFGGNFTVEAWVYPTSMPAEQVIVSQWYGGSLTQQAWQMSFVSGKAKAIITIGSTEYSITSSATYTASSWYHVAMCRSGSTLTLYVNGTSVGTATASGTTNDIAYPLVVGALNATGSYVVPFNGYISNLRITNGTAVYTSTFTPPTAPLTPSANTVLLANGMNAGIYDATGINDMETVGDAKVSTAVSKFGGSSMAFDGSGDYLSIRSVPELAFGTGDVTLECWLYLNSTSGTQTIAARWAPRGWLWQFTSSTMTVYFGTTGTSFSWSPSTSTWYHLAITRSGGSTRFFVNGTQTGSTQTNNGDASASGIITVGMNDDGIQQPLNGYIDDLRVTKGYARYTANFTPPTQAFPLF